MAESQNRKSEALLSSLQKIQAGIRGALSGGHTDRRANALQPNGNFLGAVSLRQKSKCRI